MTSVHVDLRKPQRGTEQFAPVPGALEVALLRRQTEGDQVLLTTPYRQVLVDGQTDLVLTPNDSTNLWRIRELVLNGITRYVTVPNVASIGYEDLPDVDPATLEPVPDAFAAWSAIGDRVTALEAVAPTNSAPVVVVTQAQYDALTPTPGTVYLITA